VDLPIRLDQFLQLSGLVGTGGEAKLRVQAGEVTVDGAAELRRGRKLRGGEVVALGRRSAQVPPAPG
jgi:ribosome-associated protein